MGVRNTSRQAYHSLHDLGNRQRDVLLAILDNGKPICNLDLSRRMVKPINQLTPRTNELVVAGLVEESLRGISSTGRRAIFWQVTDSGHDLINRLI